MLLQYEILKKLVTYIGTVYFEIVGCSLGFKVGQEKVKAA